MSVKILPLDRRLNNPYIKSWFLVPKNSFHDYKLKTSSKNKKKNNRNSPKHNEVSFAVDQVGRVTSVSIDER